MKIIIFAGGVGSRLWPLSRKNTPKQFEKIIGEKSTLQLAVDRLLPDFAYNDIFVSTGKKYADSVKKQLPNIPSKNIIGEPQMRDVGPAVGLMASILLQATPDEPMAILWSDHLVKKEGLFKKALKTAEELIVENPNKIIFIGQKPRFPSQNLGYISFGRELEKLNGLPFYEFKGCKYKPDYQTAKDYLSDGHHAWNLGYFVTTPRFLFDQYRQLVPDVYEKLLKISKTYQTPDFEKTLEEIYPTIEKIHFDNAILEKLNHNDAFVISENIEWSDIGAWEALKEALSESEDENVIKGKVLLEDSRDSLVFNYTDQLTVGIDLDDMLVINTGDVLLVCPKKSVPKIKKLVESLEGTEHEHLI
ncbi:MAG: sugar phosphate nucleotidyltransferase [Candidatus Levybacteria bacterium]|nr:sugar phosphate nucleotidyltransferase [Candidatus Levybacteria bacterium]